MWRVREPPCRKLFPSHTTLIGRHSLRVPPTLFLGRREAAQPEEEGPVEPSTSEDSGVILLQGFPL